MVPVPVVTFTHLLPTSPVSGLGKPLLCPGSSAPTPAPGCPGGCLLAHSRGPIPSPAGAGTPTCRQHLLAAKGSPKWGWSKLSSPHLAPVNTRDLAMPKRFTHLWLLCSLFASKGNTTTAARFLLLMILNETFSFQGFSFWSSLQFH